MSSVTSGGAPPPTTTTASADAAFSKLENANSILLAAIEALENTRKDVAADIAAVRGQKPNRGDFAEGEDGNAPYAAAVAAWQGNLQRTIAQGTRRINAALDKVNKAQADVRQAESEIPPAQAQDDRVNEQRRQSREALDQMMKDLQDSAAEMNSAAQEAAQDDKVEGQEQAQIRVNVVTDQTTGNVSLVIGASRPEAPRPRNNPLITGGRTPGSQRYRLSQQRDRKIFSCLNSSTTKFLCDQCRRT